MGTIAYQITSVSIIYLTVSTGTDQRKHQSSASLAFVRGIQRWPVNSPHKGPVAQKMFPFSDVIMILRLYTGPRQLSSSLPGITSPAVPPSRARKAPRCASAYSLTSPTGTRNGQMKRYDISRYRYNTATHSLSPFNYIDTGKQLQIKLTPTTQGRFSVTRNISQNLERTRYFRGSMPERSKMCCRKSLGWRLLKRTEWPTSSWWLQTPN